MSLKVNRHFFLLHLIVFIWGFSPILGRYITVDVWPLVWYRILITVAGMYLFLLVSRQSLRISRRRLLQLAGIGMIIMVHWLTFYGAIKQSNVSVTMVAFSTGTLFSAVIEPFFFKRKIRLYEIITGLVIIAAITMIISVETEYWQGIVLGIAAAFTSSLFGVLNGVMSHRLPPAVISFYEISAALAGLTCILAVSGMFSVEFFTLDNQSVIGLLLLALVCTVFPFITSVDLAKYISPYTIILTVNLETVYGVVWAIIFYQENREVSVTFYVGVVIILAAIFLNSYLRRFHEKRVVGRKNY